MFRDRDYLLTPEGLFFCVVGYVHPPERVVSYLKYAPEELPVKGGRRSFKRVLPYYTIPCLEETLTLLQEKYPNYIYHDDQSDVRFSAVPLTCIKRHFRPEERLRRMFSSGTKDGLESKVLDFVSTVSGHSGVPEKSFGVTGSVLTGLHNPRFSDMDITVYGRDNSLKVKATLLSLYANTKYGVERFRGSLLKDWCEEKARLYPLSLRDAESLYRRIWNRGTYEGTMFSMHPIRSKDEVHEKHSDKLSSPRAVVKVEATVEDAREAVFMPAVYLVRDVDFKSGPGVDDLSEVVSYEGLYSGIFSEDERVVVRGILEKVQDRRRGKVYSRVLVGSMRAGGRDYVKPKSSRV